MLVLRGRRHGKIVKKILSLDRQRGQIHRNNGLEQEHIDRIFACQLIDLDDRLYTDIILGIEQHRHGFHAVIDTHLISHQHSAAAVLDKLAAAASTCVDTQKPPSVGLA